MGDDVEQVARLRISLRSEHPHEARYADSEAKAILEEGLRRLAAEVAERGAVTAQA